MSEPDATTTPSQRRLQRPADFTGPRLLYFRQIFVRHGLPIALLGGLLLLFPEFRELLRSAVTRPWSDPWFYLGASIVISGVLLTYAWFIDRRLSAPAVGWVFYLLALSAWEEWVFRLAIPYFAHTQGFNLATIVIISNLIFGAMHYFTLRWKWQWCVGACIGGLALSRSMDQHFDLAFVIAAHWVATFINTPRPPGRVQHLNR